MVTLYVNRTCNINCQNNNYDYYGGYTSANGNDTIASLMFGSNKLAACDQSTWMYHQAEYNVNSTFHSFFPRLLTRTNSISMANAAPDSCFGDVKSNHTIRFSHSFSHILTSYQALFMIVDATGAYYNKSAGGYVIDCNDFNKGGNVDINMVDGNVLTLKPADYIMKTDSGICKLNVRASYDENDPWGQYSQITLGQSYMNNHCYSYNYKENTVGIADIVHQ